MGSSEKSSRNGQGRLVLRRRRWEEIKGSSSSSLDDTYLIGRSLSIASISAVTVCSSAKVMLVLPSFTSKKVLSSQLVFPRIRHTKELV